MNRYLALCGVASRRKASAVITQGRVRVCQKTITELGYQVDPVHDTVYVDGKTIRIPKCFRYVLLNKPAGILTTVQDDRNRKTVIDLIQIPERLFPVGRLDLDTEGALLLTNDGDLAYRLAHPKYEVEKVYEAWVEGTFQEKDCRKFIEGMEIEQGMVVFGEVRILKKEGNRSKLEIRIHEGKKRQIKRMMKALHHPVISLKRTCFAGLTAEGLQTGQWRDLTDKEVKKLCLITKLGVSGFQRNAFKCAIRSGGD